MDINILASGSSGNCYRITDGHSTLLLECGIPIKEIKQGLGFRLSEVSACLITHEHKDHCKAVNDILKAGIVIHASCGTAQAMGIDDYAIHTYKLGFLHAREQKEIGTFIVLPFETQHDAREPMGFLIQSNITGEKLLYATDTYYIKYRFPGLTHIMVECNYALDILEANVDAGLVHPVLRDRLIESHFSLDNVKNFLMANDLSQVQEIYLIHLSRDNSDEERFKREIQELTGKQVIVG